MNLGQLIGGLRLRIDDLEEQLKACTCGRAHHAPPPMPADAEAGAPVDAPSVPLHQEDPGPPHRRKINAKEQILNALEAASVPLYMHQIRRLAPNLPDTNASVSMLALVREGKVLRSGEPRFYQYQLPRKS